MSGCGTLITARNVPRPKCSTVLSAARQDISRLNVQDMQRGEQAAEPDGQAVTSGKADQQR